MSRNSDSSISFGVGLLFGVLAGVAAGILYSPKPGNEMREEIKSFAGSFTKDLEPEIANTKNASTDLINKLVYSIEKQYSKINDAIKAGKMAAAKRKEELESGYSGE